MVTPLNQHPLSAAFPSMSAEDFQALKDDIEVNGQREPVMLFEGMVLDGWHRYRACVELGMKPQQFTFPESDDPVVFVKTMNLHRRHLTASQRTAALVACGEWHPPHRTKKVEPSSTLPKTNKELAKEAGVSVRTVTDAKAAKEAGLLDAVRDGAMTAKEAAQVARGKEPKKTVAPPSPAPERGQTLPPADPPAANDGGLDPLVELEAAHAEIEKLTEEIKAAEADDQKAETLKWRRSYDHAQRQQSEAMDRAAEAVKREKWTMNQLRRCGKAVGEDDPKKIAAAVEAMVREVRKAA